MTMPMSRRAAIASRIGRSHCTIITAANAPMKPMTEPTDRSILPETMTMSIPSAMMMM